MRSLRRAPAFTAAVVTTLAVGIGANTAIFSVVSAVLLRPLAFPRPSQLVSVRETGVANSDVDVAPPNFLDWRAAQTAFLHLAAWTPVSLTLTQVEAPENLEGLRATAALFPALGVGPALGRTFGPEADLAGGARVVVVSDELWRSRFQADSSLVGRALNLNDEPYTVIGVMPPGFRFPVDADALFWVPMAFTESDLLGRTSHFLDAVGRLRDGVSLQAAQAEMDVIAQRLRVEHPATNQNAGVRLEPLKEAVVGAAGSTLRLLWGAVALVLLIATANVTNMLLARGVTRTREIATRVALGAGRGRLVAQLLTESAVLAALGGVAGLGMGYVGLRLLTSMDPGNIARFADASLDGRVLALTFLVAAVASLLSGLAPALALLRADPQQGLRQGARGTVGPGTGWYRRALVVGEVALALVLLVGAGLLINSLRNLMATDPGFDPDRVLSLRINLSPRAYPHLAARSQFFERVTSRLEALPGVEAAGAISFLPMAFAGGSVGIAVEGAPPPESDAFQGAVFRTVSARYFEVMGLAVIAGRPFDDGDHADAPPVAAVNQVMAQRWWPGQVPIGRRLKVGGATSTAPWLTVVAVVENAREFTLRQPPEPLIFVPVTQPHPTWTTPRVIVVRVARDPEAYSPQVRSAIWSVDPALPISDPRAMTSVVRATTAELRFHTLLLSLLGATAVSLAAAGIYGVIAYHVGRRTQEFGVRLTLGARPVALIGLVVRQGMGLAALGAAIGVVGSLALTRVLASQLYQLSPTDAATLSLGTAALLVVALAACLIPASRVARIEPVESLRHE